MKKDCLALLFFFIGIATQAQKPTDAFEKKVLINGADTLRYRILYPEGYREQKRYPMVVFLHGSGERGRDNEAQLLHGGDLFVKETIRKHFKAIVIFPQCPPDSAWSRFRRIGISNEREVLANTSAPVPQKLVKYLIDSLVKSGKADERRLYLGGLSLGGFGTYDMLIRYPGFFAAAFPICGITNIPAFLENAATTPLWIFHGGKDNVVKPDVDRELFKALLTRGIKTVQYTEYPTMGHNSWDSAFIEPRLLPWLFSNKKKAKEIR